MWRKDSLRKKVRSGVFRHAWKAAIALMLVGVAASLAGATTYLYDANGRLVVATNEEGAHARYVYDAVGNLQGIERLRPDELAIFSMEPGRGAPGAHVLIRGQGFSAATAGNRVAFNGTAAEVVRASPTSLTVVVPAGATTGFVAVEAGGASAVSPSAFIVDENEAPPVIRRIAPLRVAAGATVGIDGEHLVPIPGQSKVSVSGRFVSSARESAGNHIDFVVPANVGSGKVRVTTPFGKAESDEDLIVVPRDVSPADVDVVHRVALGAEPISLDASGSGKWVVVLFDGKLGNYLSIQSDPGTGSAVEYVVRDPANQILAKGSLSASRPSSHLPALNNTGSYAIYMKRAPEAGSWRLSVEVDPTQAIDGESRALGAWAPGQSKRFLISGRIGDNLGLGISELDAPGGSYAYVEVYRPDGKRGWSSTCYLSHGGCDVNLPRLSAGTYAVVMEPAWSRQQLQFRVTLSADVTGALSPDEWKTLVLERYGQNGRLSFTGTAGQRLGLQVSGQQTLPANCYVYYSVYAPDRTLLTSGTLRGGGVLDLPALPADGTYQVFVDPEYGETLTAQLRLATGTAEGLGVTNGSVSYEARGAGEAAYFTFAAKEGDNLGLGISELRVSGGSYAYIRVYRPDGTQWQYRYCYIGDGGCDVNLPRLSAGTYAVVVEPASSTQRLWFKATLSADVTGELVPDAWTPLVLSRPGQNGRLSFTGTAGQRLGLQVSGQQTLPADGSVYYTVYAPDRTLLTSGTLRGGGALDLSTLPADGTYQVFVDPYYGETLTAQLRLATGTAEGLGVANGSVSYEARGANEAAYFTFTAKDGDNLGLGISELQVTPENWYAYSYVRVFRPDGKQGWSSTCYLSHGGCDVNLPRLSAGTYAVVVEPTSAGQRLRFKATLSADVTGELVPDAWTPLTLSRPGQNGRLSFTGTAGQRLGLQVSGQQTLPADGSVYYYVYAPDGSLFKSLYMYNGGDVLDLPPLPADGTYQVFVDPIYGETLTAQLRLATGTTEDMRPDAGQAAYAAYQPGEVAYLTFTAKDGDNLGLGISELLTTEGTSGYAYVQIHGRGGTQWRSEACYAPDKGRGGGCGVNLPNLKAGSYAVVVRPGKPEQQLRFKATLSSDQAGQLTPDTWTTLALGRPGQNGRLSFAGNAGQRLGLQVTGQVPTNQPAYYYIYAPDGSLLTSRHLDSGNTFDFSSLPASGIYEVFVDPSYGQTLTVQFRLATGTAEGMALDGESGTYVSRDGSEVGYFTFKANAGDHLGLGIYHLTGGGPGSGIRINVYRPDGSQQASEFCYASWGSCGINLSNLKATGTYAAMIVPEYPGTPMQYSISLSRDKTARLPLEQWTTLTLPRPGQNGRLTFAGTAGQQMILQINGQTTVPVGKYVYYRLHGPDGSLLRSGSATENTWLKLPVLPADGEYQVVVDPGQGASASMRLRLDSGNASKLLMNAEAKTYERTYEGEASYFMFLAKEGDNLGLGIRNLMTVEGRQGYSARVHVYQPDGVRLDYKDCYVSTGGCGINLPSLKAGTHTVVVTPEWPNQRIRFSAALSEDVTGMLAPNAWTPLALIQPGQNGRLHFIGTAGQRLGLQIVGHKTAPVNQLVNYHVYAPDGSLLKSTHVREAGDLIDLPPLPMAGTYQVLIDPWYGETLTARLRLTSGTAKGVDLDTGHATYVAHQPSEVAYLTFTAKDGDNLDLRISNLLTTGGTSGYAYLKVLGGNGTQWTSSVACYVPDKGVGGSCSINLPQLRAGSYAVLLDPYKKDQKLSFKATLSSDRRGQLARDLWTAPVLTQPNPSGRLEFMGKAGQQFELQMATQQLADTTTSCRTHAPMPNTSPANAKSERLALPAGDACQQFIDPTYHRTPAQSRLETKSPLAHRGRCDERGLADAWCKARGRCVGAKTQTQHGKNQFLLFPGIMEKRGPSDSSSLTASGAKEGQGVHHG